MSPGDQLRWRVAAAFRMLLWRGSVALEQMIYRMHDETPVEQRVAVSDPFANATWHWEKERGYVLLDRGHKAVDVIPMHPISEN